MEKKDRKSNDFRLFQPDAENTESPQQTTQPAAQQFQLFQSPQPLKEQPQPSQPFQSFLKPPEPHPLQQAPLPSQYPKPEVTVESFERVEPPPKQAVPQQMPVLKPDEPKVDLPKQQSPAQEPSEISQSRPPMEEASSKPTRGFGNWVGNHMKPLLIAAGIMVGITIIYVIADVLMDNRQNNNDRSTSGKPELPKSPNTEKKKPEPPSPTSGNTSPSATGMGYVKTKDGTGLWLRSLPTKEAVKVTSIPNGSAVTILSYAEHVVTVDGETGKWCRVKYGGETGWVWGNFVVRK